MLIAGMLIRSAAVEHQFIADELVGDTTDQLMVAEVWGDFWPVSSTVPPSILADGVVYRSQLTVCR